MRRFFRLSRSRHAKAAPAAEAVEAVEVVNVVEDPADYPMGMVIGDGYILGSAVMKGGMATIRHAATPTTEQVVIKFTSKSIHYERELAALRTIQSIEGEISCKNIINYQDYYTPDDLDDHIPFYLIVLEKGTASLQASLGNNRPLPCDDFKPILKDIIGGLKALKHANLVHCDLKPGNVMFFASSGISQGVWKLIDFDCAAPVDSPVHGFSIDFAAPEIVMAYEAGASLPAAHSMDMFSFGQILYWIASSRSIWGSEGSKDAMTRLLCGKDPLPVSPSTFDCTPVYSMAKDLLIRNPADRMTIDTLSLKTFFADCLDTTLFSHSQHMKEPAQGSPLSDVLEMSDSHTSFPTDHAAGIHHREMQAMWRERGWEEVTTLSALRKCLKRHLSSDPHAQKRLKAFFKIHVPRVKPVDPTLSISTVNRIFPMAITDIPIGDWILHQTHESQWANVRMLPLILGSIDTYLDAEPVLYIHYSRSFQEIGKALRSARKALESLPGMDPFIQARIQKVLAALSVFLGRAMTGGGDGYLDTAHSLSQRISTIREDSKKLSTSVDKKLILSYAPVLEAWIREWTAWREEVIAMDSECSLYSIDCGSGNSPVSVDILSVPGAITEAKSLCEFSMSWREAVRANHEQALRANADAMCWMGRAFYDGSNGVREDEEMASLWLDRAVSLDHPEAMTLRAAMNSDGAYHPWAYNYFQRAHQLGYAPATAKYGLCLHQGWGCDADRERGEVLFKEAFLAGRWEGAYCSMHWGMAQGDYARIEEMAQEIWSMGSVAGFFSIIHKYLTSTARGPELEIGYKKAWHYCDLISKRDTPDDNVQSSAWRLDHFYFPHLESSAKERVRYYRGIILFFGLGVPVDQPAAFAQWESGRDKGHECLGAVTYCLMLGKGVERDVVRGEGILHGTSGEGDAVWHMVMLAYCHLEGIGSEGKQPEKAVAYLQRYLDHNSTGIHFLYGRCLDEGRGIEKSSSLAVLEWRKGALMGCNRCKVALAKKQLIGEGCEKDVEGAIVALREMSADKIPRGRDGLAMLVFDEIWIGGTGGNAEAMATLGVCYLDGVGVGMDKKTGLSWLEKASKSGSTRAHMYLYRWYTLAGGGSVDQARAAKYLGKAAKQGDEEAISLYCQYLSDRSNHWRHEI